jgi:hypothetical protein
MRPRKIGYAKLGRSMPLQLEKCGSLGGDVEMVPTLKLLAERHPDVQFVLIGRNSGEVPSDVGLPSNVINPWIAWRHQVRRELRNRGLTYANLRVEDHIRVKDLLVEITGRAITDLDGIVMWLGQHGTTNTPLPSIKDRSVLTKPYDWATLYASYLLQGINTWRDVDPHGREEVLLNSDVRNYVKYRDAKWPWKHPVLGQFNQANAVKHEQGDHVALSTVKTVYSRIEISSLVPGTPFGDTITYDTNVDRPHDFGIVFNETRREVPYDKSRRRALKDWVLPNSPGFIHGKWSEATLRQLDVSIRPIPQLDYLAKLQSTRCTLTTPASGSGWATAKPWEAFAVGVVCFFHPLYDTQSNILADAPNALYEWLRVRSPLDLRDRIRYMRDNPVFWREVIDLQRTHFDDAVHKLQYLHMIEERLGL